MLPPRKHYYKEKDRLEYVKVPAQCQVHTGQFGAVKEEGALYMVGD